jgi:hypothetical protein
MTVPICPKCQKETKRTLLQDYQQPTLYQYECDGANLTKAKQHGVRLWLCKCGHEYGEEY